MLCTVRPHRLQCLPSSLLWSVDGVGSTCGSPCGCMRRSQQCDAEHAARRWQRQGPTAPGFGCFYGHGAMLKPLGGQQGGAGGLGQHLQMWSARHPRHAPQHSQGAPPSPLTQVRDRYGCLELRMTGIRSGDGGGRDLEVPHPERVFLRQKHRGMGTVTENRVFFRFYFRFPGRSASRISGFPPPLCARFPNRIRLYDPATHHG
jgi:hypothetical protein